MCPQLGKLGYLGADQGLTWANGRALASAGSVLSPCFPAVPLSFWCGCGASDAGIRRVPRSRIGELVHPSRQRSVSSYGPRPCRAVSATTSTRCSVKDSSMEAHSSSRSPVS